MVETIGKQLSRARQARGLSLEEAALDTRIRVSQLAALEADDYSTFGNNTYARGFLQIYGKFLRVDVGHVARELESGNPISVGDYQYLNAVTEEEPQREAPRARPVSRRDPERRRPSFAPLIVFLVMLGVAGLGAHLYIQSQRLDTSSGKGASTSDSVGEDVATPGSTPAPLTAPPGATAASTPAPALPAIPPPATPTPFTNPGLAADRSFLPATSTPPPLNPAATSAPTAAVQPPVAPQPLPAMNELVIEPLKKTWVRIRRDDPTAEPIYDDILYPKVGLLKLRGSRFWVEAREPDALALRKNGQAVAIPAPGEAIQ